MPSLLEREILRAKSILFITVSSVSSSVAEGRQAVPIPNLLQGWVEHPGQRELLSKLGAARANDISVFWEHSFN